jgi:hypothetical protein
MKTSLKWCIIRSLAFVPDSLYVTFQHYLHLGFFPNLKNPKTMSEYFMVLKLRKNSSELIKYTHKVQAKEWITSMIGSSWVVPTLLTKETLTIEELIELPMPYIIKPTLGSQHNFIINNFEDLKSLSLQHVPHHLLYRERNYEGKPGWIVEPMLDDLTQVQDYKALCFNGRVEMIQVSLNNEKKSRCMVDREGRVMHYPFASGSEDSFELTYRSMIPEMIRVAEVLSKSFEFVRIDFMCTPRGIKISELTFFPQGGYSLRKDKAMNQQWISYFKKKEIIYD